jgi:hypothetical protein
MSSGLPEPESTRFSRVHRYVLPFIRRRQTTDFAVRSLGQL